MLVDTEQIIKPSDVQIFIDDDGFNFHENFVKVENEDDTYLYIDYGNLSKQVDYSVLPRQKGKVIKALIELELVDYTITELREMDTETVYEHFTSCYGIYSDYDCYLSDYLDTCKRYNIKTKRDSYVEFNLSGYSQGDSRKVIINKDEAEKVWGTTIEQGISYDTLHELFHDQPYNVRLDIMGTEFISEQDGCYQFDKDKLIAELLEFFKDEIDNLEFFEEQLEDLIPSEPN